MAIRNNVIQGQNLFLWQNDFFKLYLTHQTNSVIVIKSGRQRGKSHTLQNLVMLECINKPKFHTIIICPTYNLCRKFFKDLTDLLQPIPQLVKSANSSYLEIELTNKSVISLKSAESKDNLRGFTCDLLIFDEAAFINMETALECFNYVNTTNGNIILASTPKFKDDSNLFARYWNMAERKEKNVYGIDFCRYNTSALLSNERKEMYKKQLPFNIYQNEIEGEFLELSNNLWDIQPILKNNVAITQNLVCGIDFASGVNNDETAIAIFNQDKQLFKLIHFNDKDSNQTIDFVINLLKELPIKKLVIEVNSLGKVFFDVLRKKVSQNNIRCTLLPFTTTNESKRQVIETMQCEIQNQTISLLDDFTLKTQFSAFEMKSTPSGLITYGNSNNSIHDDIVIACALGLYGLSQGQYYIK